MSKVEVTWDEPDANEPDANEPDANEPEWCPECGRRLFHIVTWADGDPA